MRNYSEYEFASVSMSTDEAFKDALYKLFTENDFTHIVESGTFLGKGSTTSVAKAIIKSGKKISGFYNHRS